MRYARWALCLPAVLGCAVLMLAAGQAYAGSKSSCVSCHLDEMKLIDSLAEVKTKKSAMQSGAG